MKAVIPTLIEFSKNYNLRQTTIQQGIKSLENWMKECPEEHSQLFPELNSSNFHFENVSQHLIFFQHDREIFVLRTRYSLFTDHQKDRNAPVGWYAFDVNENGEFVDDWLVFE